MRTILILLIIIKLPSCYPVHGGNRGGPAFMLIDTAHVWFDLTGNRVYLLDSSLSHLSVQVIANDTSRYFKVMSDTISPKSYHDFAADFFEPYKRSKIVIEIMPDYFNVYHIHILPEDWDTKKKKFGYYKRYSR